MPISNFRRGPRTAVGLAAALLIAMRGALAAAAPLVVATIALPDPGKAPPHALINGPRN